MAHTSASSEACDTRRPGLKFRRGGYSLCFGALSLKADTCRIRPYWVGVHGSGAEPSNNTRDARGRGEERRERPGRCRSCTGCTGCTPRRQDFTDANNVGTGTPAPRVWLALGHASRGGAGLSGAISCEKKGPKGREGGSRKHFGRSIGTEGRGPKAQGSQKGPKAWRVGAVSLLGTSLARRRRRRRRRRRPCPGWARPACGVHGHRGALRQTAAARSGGPRRSLSQSRLFRSIRKTVRLCASRSELTHKRTHTHTRTSPLAALLSLFTPLPHRGGPCVQTVQCVGQRKESGRIVEGMAAWRPGGVAQPGANRTPCRPCPAASHIRSPSLGWSWLSWRCRAGAMLRCCGVSQATVA